MSAEEVVNDLLDRAADVLTELGYTTAERTIDVRDFHSVNPIELSKAINEWARASIADPTFCFVRPLDPFGLDHNDKLIERLRAHAAYLKGIR